MRSTPSVAGLVVVGLVVSSLGGSCAVEGARAAPPTETCTVTGTITTAGAPQGPVIVYETGPNGPPPTQPVSAVIPQKNKAFATPWAVVSSGAKVDFPNDDQNFHHLYSHSPQDPFDFPKHPPGARPSRHFYETGDSRVRCQIHPWMEAHVLVLPNGWSTTVAPNGTYSLQIAAGTRTVEVWSAWHRPIRLERFDCTPGSVHELSGKLKSRSPPAYGDYLDQ